MDVYSVRTEADILDGVDTFTANHTPLLISNKGNVFSEGSNKSSSSDDTIEFEMQIEPIHKVGQENLEVVLSEICVEPAKETDNCPAVDKSNTKKLKKFSLARSFRKSNEKKKMKGSDKSKTFNAVETSPPNDTTESHCEAKDDKKETDQELFMDPIPYEKENDKDSKMKSTTKSFIENEEQAVPGFGVEVEYESPLKKKTKRHVSLASLRLFKQNGRSAKAKISKTKRSPRPAEKESNVDSQPAVSRAKVGKESHTTDIALEYVTKIEKEGNRAIHVEKINDSVDAAIEVYAAVENEVDQVKNALKDMQPEASPDEVRKENAAASATLSDCMDAENMVDQDKENVLKVPQKQFKQTHNTSDKACGYLAAVEMVSLVDSLPPVLQEQIRKDSDTTDEQAKKKSIVDSQPTVSPDKAGKESEITDIALEDITKNEKEGNRAIHIEKINDNADAAIEDYAAVENEVDQVKDALKDTQPKASPDEVQKENLAASATLSDCMDVENSVDQGKEDVLQAPQKQVEQTGYTSDKDCGNLAAVEMVSSIDSLAPVLQEEVQKNNDTTDAAHADIAAVEIETDQGKEVTLADCLPIMLQEVRKDSDTTDAAQADVAAVEIEADQGEEVSLAVSLPPVLQEQVRKDNDTTVAAHADVTAVGIETDQGEEVFLADSLPPVLQKKVRKDSDTIDAAHDDLAVVKTETDLDEEVPLADSLPPALQDRLGKDNDITGSALMHFALVKNETDQGEEVSLVDPPTPMLQGEVERGKGVPETVRLQFAAIENETDQTNEATSTVEKTEAGCSAVKNEADQSKSNENAPIVEKTLSEEASLAKRADWENLTTKLMKNVGQEGPNDTTSPLLFLRNQAESANVEEDLDSTADEDTDEDNTVGTTSTSKSSCSHSTGIKSSCSHTTGTASRSFVTMSTANRSNINSLVDYESINTKQKDAEGVWKFCGAMDPCGCQEKDLESPEIIEFELKKINSTEESAVQVQAHADIPAH